MNLSENVRRAERVFTLGIAGASIVTTLVTANKAREISKELGQASGEVTALKEVNQQNLLRIHSLHMALENTQMEGAENVGRLSTASNQVNALNTEFKALEAFTLRTLRLSERLHRANLEFVQSAEGTNQNWANIPKEFAVDYGLLKLAVGEYESGMQEVARPAKRAAR